MASSSAVNENNLIFNLNVLILSFVALLFLLALPAAVARFSNASGWRDGWFFKSVAVKSIRRHAGIGENPKLSPVNPAKVSRMTTDPYFQSRSEKPGKGAANYTFEINLGRNGSNSSSISRSKPQNLPVHMPSWSTMLPALTSAFNVNVRPGLTVSQAMLLFVYFIVILGFSFYKSNPLSDFVRAGMIATSQIPLVVILATKNNLLGELIGYGYEKLNYFHRFSGRIIVLGVNVHAIGYFYEWTAAGDFSQKIARPSNTAGLVALIAADLLLVLSFSTIRDVCYPLFLSSHVIAAIVLLAGTVAHEPWTMPYVGIAVAFYALDRILRLVKTRFTTARLHAIPETNMTRIEIPSVNAGWRAGQHLRIRVLSLGMGWFGWFESHPFTIASVSRNADGDGIVLMCKKAGDWTGKLFELAKRSGYGEACGVGPQVKVLVEGPYGGPVHAVVPSYSGVMLVAGGSGITYALSTAQELLQKGEENASRVKAIELVWSMPDPAQLVPMIPVFSRMLVESKHTPTSLRISVFYTRAPSGERAFKGLQSLPPGLVLAPGRPRLPKILEDVIDRTCSMFDTRRGRSERDGPLTGVMLGVCGPLSLADDATRAIRTVMPERRRAVGGVELHEEVFGW